MPGTPMNLLVNLHVTDMYALNPSFDAGRPVTRSMVIVYCVSLGVAISSSCPCGW
jgi:hypothetical protein